MSYKLKCRSCGREFTANSKHAKCSAYWCESSSTSVLEDLADVAVSVAVGYAVGDIAGDVISGVGSMIGSIFD